MVIWRAFLIKMPSYGGIFSAVPARSKERSADKMDTKELLLSNAQYRLRYKDGFLSEIYPGTQTSGERDTAYIYPGKVFGGVRLTVETASGVTAYQAEPEHGKMTMWEGTADGWPACFAESTDAAWPVKISIEYRLCADSLLMTLTLRNTGAKPLRVRDLGLPLPCNSHFDWGVSAADKVLGHHFIAASGTHMMLERCDGRGPRLLILPQQKTSVEYFTADETIQGKAGFIAYFHSEAVRQKAVEAGARIHIPATGLALQPNEESSPYTLRFVWAQDDQDARSQLVANHLVDVQVLPGMTAPANAPVRLCLTTKWQGLRLELPENTEMETASTSEERHFYTLTFRNLGENTVWVCDAGGRRMNLDFFITLPMKTMLNKRAAFIANHRHTDPSKWYNGLLAEWNNETGVLLGPDEYDRITGWRIYEVTCDDPGLSKPAFLSSKLAVLPEDAEIRAMDDYLEHFVWGGLQCTEKEPYPYAIYGIPDWKTLRNSNDPDVKGKLHIWRIYDYPHITLMYYNLYRILKQNPAAPLTQDRDTYLLRAYHTAIAMFTVPLELDNWSAFGTGLYNELVIEDLLTALDAEGHAFEKQRLERLWNRKAFTFAQKNADVFGSEYPFDTTGFESTHALAKRAMKIAVSHPVPPYDNGTVTADRAAEFMGNQIRCNIACRGLLEPAYYWYGSDYRGSNTGGYLLSYMSQMGGWAILDYALYYAKDPYPLLRLGYGAAMSSWALLNAGDEASNYGFWFPGKANDGAASGGFEPQFLGETWLNQPHHGGAWYYSCEIDLGFCGYMRCAACILAEDPLFGRVCLGGTLLTDGDEPAVQPEDGVCRRAHYISDTRRVHVIADTGSLLRVTYGKDRVHVQIAPPQATGKAMVTVTVTEYGADAHAEQTQTQTANGMQTLVFMLE